MKMIADPFSRMVLLPARQEAFTLPEIVFDSTLGNLIHAEKVDKGRESRTMDMLLYSPGSQLKLCEERQIELECEDDIRSERVLCHCTVPVTTEHEWASVMGSRQDEEETSLEVQEEAQISMGPAAEVPLFNLSEVDKVDKEPVQEEEVEVVDSPTFTKSEYMKLEAVRFVRAYLQDGSLPDNTTLAKTVKSLANKMTLSDEKVWILRDDRILEVLDSTERFKEVLLILHEGMGHRALGSVYSIFSQRFWIPGASKLISRHILACRTCQEFSKQNPLKSPGFRVTPTDIFTHWSIDFAGPFPKDSQNGCQFVCLAVEWVSGWVEAAATIDASAESAADFIYNNIVTRYGCPVSLQSDNGTHYIKPIIRALL